MAEWQTHMTQNHAGNHAGSSPATGTFHKWLRIKVFSLFLAIFCCLALPKDEVFFTLYEVFFTLGMTRSMPRNSACHTSLLWLIYWRFMVLCFSCFGCGMPRFAKSALRNVFLHGCASVQLFPPLLDILVLGVYPCAVCALCS